MKITKKSTTENVFRGQFTPEIRKAFWEHRAITGASYQLLAEILNVHWSTIRKWEDGQTTACHGRHTARIRRFLNGYYDHQIERLQAESDNISNVWKSMPKELQLCLMNAVKFYSLCANKTDLVDTLIERLNDAISSSVMLLLENTDKECRRQLLESI